VTTDSQPILLHSTFPRPVNKNHHWRRTERCHFVVSVPYSVFAKLANPSRWPGSVDKYHCTLSAPRLSAQRWADLHLQSVLRMAMNTIFDEQITPRRKLQITLEPRRPIPLPIQELGEGPAVPVRSALALGLGAREHADLNRPPPPRLRGRFAGSIRDNTTISVQGTSLDDAKFPSQKANISISQTDHYTTRQKRRASSPLGGGSSFQELPGAGELLRRREGASRGSLPPRLTIPQSLPSLGQSTNPYISPLPLTPTSITGSFGQGSPGGLSPGAMSPVDGICNSPFCTPGAMSPVDDICNSPHHIQEISLGDINDKCFMSFSRTISRDSTSGTDHKRSACMAILGSKHWRARGPRKGSIHTSYENPKRNIESVLGEDLDRSPIIGRIQIINDIQKARTPRVSIRDILTVGARMRPIANGSVENNEQEKRKDQRHVIAPLLLARMGKRRQDAARDDERASASHHPDIR
jgi:hypothetical protein